MADLTGFHIAYTICVIVVGFMLGRNSTDFRKKLEDSVHHTIDALVDRNYIRKKYENGEWHLLTWHDVWQEGYDTAKPGAKPRSRRSPTNPNP